MSIGEKSLIQVLVDSWVSRFLEIFEAQAGIQAFESENSPHGQIAGESGLVGVEQLLDQSSGAFWIGVTEAQAEQIGRLLLRADDAGEPQCREALFDVMRSSLDAAVRSAVEQFRLGNVLQGELRNFSADEARRFTPVRFSGPDLQFEFYLGISPQLQKLIVERAGASAGTPSGSALDLLYDCELPVSFSFGRKKLALRDVLKLAPSSVVELDRAPDDLVEVIVNDSVIAWGEVVSVDGQYGIRIRRIAPAGLRSTAMNSGPGPGAKALVGL